MKETFPNIEIKETKNFHIKWIQLTISASEINKSESYWKNRFYVCFQNGPVPKLPEYYTNELTENERVSRFKKEIDSIIKFFKDSKMFFESIKERKKWINAQPKEFWRRYNTCKSFNEAISIYIARKDYYVNIGNY